MDWDGLPIYAVIALCAALALRAAVIQSVVAWMTPIWAQRDAEAAENHRLASDADYQDAAFHSGDLRTAVYGRFQP